MSGLAIILARGGSKRIPRKNVIPFRGKPLLAWTIEAALASGVFEHVLVSTDDEAIAEIAQTYGADVPFLRQIAADDNTPSSEATIAALHQAENYWGKKFEFVAQLMANCPLRDAEDIRDAVHVFLERDVPAQLSCFKFGWMNPWWAVKLDEQSRPEALFPQALKTRSQDLPSLFCPTGAIWLAQTDQLIKHKTFYVPGHVFHPLDWVSAIDIDEVEDLLMANAGFEIKEIRVAAGSSLG